VRFVAVVVRSAAHRETESVGDGQVVTGCRRVVERGVKPESTRRVVAQDGGALPVAAGGRNQDNWVGRARAGGRGGLRGAGPFGRDGGGFLVKETEREAFPGPGVQGIGAESNKFFDAWSGLASNPNDPSAKLTVQQAGQTLVTRVRQTFASLSGEKANLTTSLNGAFDRVDRLSATIADLNDEITAKLATGAMPNDLMDARGASREELRGLRAIPVQTYESGPLAVPLIALAVTVPSAAATRSLSIKSPARLATCGESSTAMKVRMRGIGGSKSSASSGTAPNANPNRSGQCSAGGRG